MAESPPPCNNTECLTQIMKSKEMADLTIIIPGHKENFKVHRLVLGMWSRVFQAMLFGPMAEGDSITLTEDHPEAFKWLINCMYTDKTDLPSVELALHVYLLANKYLIGHMKTVCSKFLIDKVNAVSVPEVLNIATLLDDAALIDKCAEVLENSPDTFFLSPKIGALNSNSLKQLLKKDLPVSSEVVIFQGIINWGKAHLKSKENEKNLRQIFDEFLPHVRFLTMSLEEFVKCVLPENIFTFEEVQAVQLNIAGVPDISLPSLFSTKKEIRNRFNISRLQICHIRHELHIGNSGHRYAINPDILAQIQPVNRIFVGKLEYDVNIGYTGNISVKDASGLELRQACFDGRIATFDMPFKMEPENKYTFTLKDGGNKTFYNHTYTIADNGIISGNMMNNFIRPCIFHYWK